MEEWPACQSGDAAILRVHCHGNTMADVILLDMRTGYCKAFLTSLSTIPHEAR